MDSGGICSIRPRCFKTPALQSQRRTAGAYVADRTRQGARLHCPRRTTASTLGDDGLRTLLMMVLRNHTTDSPWPVSNNPGGRYNQRVRDDGTPRLDCNLDLPLWQLVRASTARRPSSAGGRYLDWGHRARIPVRVCRRRGDHLQQSCLSRVPDGHCRRTGSTGPPAVTSYRGLGGTGKAANARMDLQNDDLWLLDHAKNIPRR